MKFWSWQTLEELVNGDKPIMTETETRIYNVVRDNLGEHLTLNENVNPEVGCAEAVSKVLQLAGISVPSHGIAGTAALLAWLQSNPDFEAIEAPEQGCIIVSATGAGNGSVRGHTGILAAFNLMYANDWGICSNDSNTGTLREQWCLKDWIAYYEDKGALKTHYFRPL